MYVRSWLVLTALAVAGLLLGGLSPAQSATRPNLLILVMDTLRADAMGVYGQKLPVTPNLDKLAAESAVWTRAYTQYTWTLPSYVSYMTSTFARSHGWTSKMGALDTYRVMAPPAPTIAEVLKGAGYGTVGVYSNEHLRADLGFGKGFDHWGKGAEAGVVRAAVADLGKWAGDGKPNFLYVHLMAPHVPLIPSAESMAAVGASFTYDATKGVNYTWWTEAPAADKERRLQELRLAYLASVRDGDARMGEILRALDASGERGNTVVAFFSDHGEVIGEHGQAGHGPMVWEEVARVPMFIRAAGIAPRKITERVGRTVDLAPTLAGLVGVAAPSQWQGRSLFDPAKTLAVVERDHLIAFTDGQGKVVEDRTKETLLSSYALTTDPGEASAGRDPSVGWVKALMDAGAAWRAGTPVGQNDGTLLQLSDQERDETLRQLEALGYTQ